LWPPFSTNCFESIGMSRYQIVAYARTLAILLRLTLAPHFGASWWTHTHATGVMSRYCNFLAGLLHKPPVLCNLVKFINCHLFIFNFHYLYLPCTSRKTSRTSPASLRLSPGSDLIPIPHIIYLSPSITDVLVRLCRPRTPSHSCTHPCYLHFAYCLAPSTDVLAGKVSRHPTLANWNQELNRHQNRLLNVCGTDGNYSNTSCLV